LVGGNQPFEPGHQIQLELRLRGWATWLESRAQCAERRNQPLTAVAEVARCEHGRDSVHRLGLKFTNICPAHRQALAAYLQSYRPTQSRLQEIRSRHGIDR
jgi:hypothetical protein